MAKLTFKRKVDVTPVVFGHDPVDGKARPNTRTAIYALGAAVLTIGLWTGIGTSVRADLAQLDAEATTLQTTRDALAVRLEEARDASRDDRINLLRTNGATLDNLVPATDTATSIEQFEVTLPDLLATYGLEASELSRAPQLADGEAGGRYVAIRANLAGPRDGLFGFLDSLQDLDRLVTVHNLQFSFDREDPSRIVGQAQLRLWFTDEPTLETLELQATGAAPVDQAEEPTLEPETGA